MASAEIQARLGQTLIDFSTDGAFPEEESVSSATIDASALPAALTALRDAKTDLENEVKSISRESATDVDSWITNAKSLQDDIEHSRRLASEIVRQAKIDEHKEDTLRDKQSHMDFLSKEMTFHSQLLMALRSIQEVSTCLDNAEELIEQRRILDALRMLEDAWTVMARVPMDKHTRAITLLDQRCFKLRDTAHEHLVLIWDHLIRVDNEEKSITINKSLLHESTNLEEAIIGLKAYKELDKSAVNLWHNIDKVILIPRTSHQLGDLPSIQISENSLQLSNDAAGHTIKALLKDVESVIRFLNNNLPSDLVKPLSHVMMPVLSARIKEDWLDTAVPASLDDMIDYQKALALVDDFTGKLRSLGWPGVDSFNDWVANSPKIWLAKRRESALDWVRHELSLGIGSPQFAERLESRMLERDEGDHLAATSNIVNQDWDAAWDSDEDEKSNMDGDDISPAQNRHSLEEERRASEVVLSPNHLDGDGGDNDAAEAWGWGDDDDDEIKAPELNQTDQATKMPRSGHNISQNNNTDVRQVTMSEKYWTSSMPQPVMRTLTQIFEDGAKLTRPESEHIPVAAAAPGLFSLPTLILAMYRAVGPFHYANNPSGNMFLYNDAMWLVDQLRSFVSNWKARDDLPTRAYGMVRLDAEIAVMESFSKRAYTNELNSQRTIINDLLGGTQNFFQDDSSDLGELKLRTTTVIEHIRSKAAAWEHILSSSASASAIGSLVNSVATRLINDIFELPSMSVTEAETAATIISLVEQLDDLFLPNSRNGHRNGSPQLPATDEIPLTAQFADKWMKMKYLSQTLQSNLSDIHYLWFESELSYYFSAAEVVDLIELSFENNPQVRGEIRKIRENPHPIGA